MPDDRAATSGLPARSFATLLSNLEGLVYRCLADARWTMEFVSDGSQALTGYAAEDLLAGREICFEDIIHPQDRMATRHAVLTALKHSPRFSVEYRIVRADGQVRWVWERGTGLYDASGQLEFIEGFIQDISVRVEAEFALREAERSFRSIFENAVEGIFQSTPQQGYLAVNPALARMYGFENPRELIDQLRDIDRQLYVDSARRAQFMRLLDEQESITNFESRVYRRDGEIIWVSENARAVRDPEGTLLFYEGTVECITERKMHEARIRFQATHDPLTCLPNRTLLQDRMQQAILHARRHGTMAALVFVDLDHFKLINDSLGHEVGDLLLRTVAERLKSCVRRDDTVARNGGDEFVLVLANQADLNAITQTVQRLLAAVSQPWMANGKELQITCSMGVSICPVDGFDVEVLLRNADAAMYMAKQSGRNHFRYFSEEMNSTVTDRLEVLNNLRRALANDELLLHYQPKIKSSTGVMVGMEALIRWKRADGSMTSPLDFIPLAEETGLILPIGEWVLETACARNVAMQRAGHAPIPVSVNLSPLQLERGNIVEVVARVLESTGLQARFLELEITENVLMRDVEKSLKVLCELKQLGVKLSIDDFGTGYSSLSYLKSLPVDTLKIDQAFVRDIAVDQDDAAIVKAVISLAHILNLNVLAEGVETLDQYNFLLNNGCDEVQGYYFGRPVAPAEFEKNLLDNGR